MKRGRKRILDKDQFHSFLWESSDRFGRVKFSQTDLAADLDVSRRTIVRLLAEMKEQQLIREETKGHNGIVTFRITKP